jgi:cardiolipin synthase
VSTFGKVLDPTADRLLVGTAVISVMVYGAVPLWFGIATIAREVLVSVMVVLLASLGAARIDVLWVGKAGTFGLMFAYPTFLLAYGDATWQEPFKVIAWGSGIIGLTLAWIAAGSYIGPAKKALQDGRAARRSRRTEPGMKEEPDVKRSPA